MVGLACSGAGMCDTACSHLFSRSWHWAGKKALPGFDSAWPINNYIDGLELDLTFANKLQSWMQSLNVLVCCSNWASLHRTGTEMQMKFSELLT